MVLQVYRVVLCDGGDKQRHVFIVGSQQPLPCKICIQARQQRLQESRCLSYMVFWIQRLIHYMMR